MTTCQFDIEKLPLTKFDLKDLEFQLEDRTPLRNIAHAFPNLDCEELVEKMSPREMIFHSL